MTHNPRTAAFFALLLLITIIGSYFTVATPTGASIQSNTTAGQPTSTAGSRNDSGGTITTLILSSVQQDTRWKAYVGNVSGFLSLDDAAGNTIYDWNVGSTSVAGELYVTRFSSVTFGSLSCVTANNISAESTYMNMSLSQLDGVNMTFNYTSHQAITVGTVPPVILGADTCRSTATYILDVRQTMDGSQTFQEVLAQDPSSRTVYITVLDDNTNGYNNQSYDFQIIVPENPSNASQTVYYFYTELDG